MSKHNFSLSLDLVLKHEGGFVDHPEDPGGATNKGITLETFRLQMEDPNLTVEDLKNITEEQLAYIYLVYWSKVEGDVLPSGVDYCVFDAGVNHGWNRSIKFLQKAVNMQEGIEADSGYWSTCDVDGVIGPQTLNAIAEVDVSTLLADYYHLRMEFYKRLSTFPTFGKGWSKRARGVFAVSYLMYDNRTLNMLRESVNE
jgi:lysozyme family protein